MLAAKGTSRAVLIIAFAWLTGCYNAQDRVAGVQADELHTIVDDLLTDSQEKWNGGDLDGFMFWYQVGPETSFMGSDGPFYGWEQIRDRYAPRFGPDASRDSLRFENIETRPIAPWLGLATARYVLFKEDSVTATGIFTLIVKHTAEGWRIVHDHSSSTD
jgi:hypothetical protein